MVLGGISGFPSCLGTDLYYSSHNVLFCHIPQPAWLCTASAAFLHPLSAFCRFSPTILGCVLTMCLRQLLNGSRRGLNQKDISLLLKSEGWFSRVRLTRRAPLPRRWMGVVWGGRPQLPCLLPGIRACSRCLLLGGVETTSPQGVMPTEPTVEETAGSRKGMTAG